MSTPAEQPPPNPAPLPSPHIRRMPKLVQVLSVVMAVTKRVDWRAREA